MAYTLALSDARAEVVHIAGIDGKTGSNGRHPPSRIDAILNRKYRALVSRAGRLGLPHGLSQATGTLGGQLAGEDYVQLSAPADAAEVFGIDVRGGATGLQQWSKLDPLSWEQRRDVYLDQSGGVLCAGVLPRHGVGFWATSQGPKVDQGPPAVLVPAKMAIWPLRIGAASYTLHYASQWPGITDDAEVFLLHDGWDEWLLNAAAMVCAQRDSNKLKNYETANAAWLAADQMLEDQAARIDRSGSIEPTPYGGIQL